MSMRKTLLLLGIALSALLATSPALAQSSGNFAAKVNTTQCVIDNGDGSLDGGIGATLLETTIKTPNSGSTALVIRPSLVTGLFTRTKVDTTTTTATAFAGVRVRVTIDNKVVAPGAPVGSTDPDDGWVFYEKRWQQVTANFFSNIAACVLAPTTCNLELVLSTLSAHSLDFVVGDVGGGDHALKVEWKFEDSDATAGDAAACVGPAVLTVQQVKTFSTGGGIVIGP